MKIIKGIYVVSFMFLSFVSYSQTVDEWAQDGKMVFQFKPEYNINLPMLDNNYVDFRASAFFLPYIDEFKIISVRRLHPEINDKKLLHTYQIEFKEIWKVNDLIQIFQSFEEIEYAEVKTLHKTFFTPNDQLYNSTAMWGLFKINASQAWNISQGSSSIIVAVTDDAIHTAHPDLVNKMVPGRDVAMNDANPNPSGQANGDHGTHVSGIVGAQTNNIIGVASIGFNTSIMPVKIARDSDGVLVAGYQGIIWAADNGAHVINMSWGGGGFSNYGQNVINYAYNLGAILVAGAGNDGVETPFYPAAFNNVIAVASTNSNDAKSSFSQYGTWIDVCAPGSNIASTIPNTGYQQKSGTSMASPLVAGLIGLMKSVNPTLSQADLIYCLTSTCDNIYAANPNFIGKLGSGRINAYAALQCMQATTVNLDAGIINITQPTATVCSLYFIPIVVLRNFGMDTLTSVSISYQLNTDTIQTFNWTGNLMFGKTDNVSLPVMAPIAGGHTLRVFTQNPNNGIDENAANDERQISFTMFDAGVSLPFTETFESSSFATNQWTIVNPDGSVTWAIDTVVGTAPGNKAVKMHFFNYSATGQRDAMISPPINLRDYADAQLTFEHAYRRFNTTATDSLIISVSVNCGNTFTKVLALGENGSGNFATGTTTTSDFTPTSSNDWCSGPIGSACKTVNLNPFVSFERVVIKFEAFNNNRNNLYIDNINITGNPLTTLPTIQFKSSVSSLCEGQPATFTDQSAPAVTSRTWSFYGGTPTTSTSKVQTVFYNTAGTFDVNLSATNNLGTSNQKFQNYITVHPLPIPPTIQQNGSILSVTLQSGQTVRWLRNNIIISGATQPTFQATQIGNYKARITSQHGCFSFTDEVYVNPTSVDEFDFKTNSMFVYPNPAKDEVYVFLETEVFVNTELIITDITGKKVASHVIQAGEKKLKINVSLLSLGTYLLSLNGKNYCNTVRLLIIR